MSNDEGISNGSRPGNVWEGSRTGNAANPQRPGDTAGTPQPGNAAGAAGAAQPGNAGAQRPGNAARAPQPGNVATALSPLLIDVGIPLGSYYVLHAALGASVWLSLALSSLVPAARSAWSLTAGRRFNLLAILMVSVNLAGIVVSFLTGDPRAMIAKDSVVSSVIALAILGSVAARRPLMSTALKPFMTRGAPERVAAWDRLSAGSTRFRRIETVYSLTWGLALLADCIGRLAGAYLLPLTTMVWLSTVMILAAISVGVVAGCACWIPIETMITAETEAHGGTDHQQQAGHHGEQAAGDQGPYWASCCQPSQDSHPASPAITTVG